MIRARVIRLLVAVAALVLVGCQADVAINLDVQPDGSGTVVVEAVVDAEVDDAVGGLASQLRTTDLADVGWQVVDVQADDGTVILTATKRVASRGEWQAALDDIAGPGVFNDVQVTSTTEFANAKQRLSFTLDLSDGWRLFSDDETLTDGRDIDDIVSLTMTATVASGDDGAPASETFTPRFDHDEPLQVDVASATENSTAVLVRWIAIALFSLFVLATVLAMTGIVLQRRSDRLRPNPTPASLVTRVPGADSEASATPTAAPVPKKESVRLVVLEPLSVLYQQTLSIDSYLLPFVREHGGTARADTILEGHRSLVAGSTDTHSFWELCGVPHDGARLDGRYLERRSLRPGAVAFLAEMQNRRIPVAATSNDAATWSEHVRDRDRLSAVWPWLVSSSVGTTTANGAMFEVLRRESGVAYGHCLYVDTDLDSLDAAKDLGMKTALFDSGDLELPDVIGHPVVTNFKGLFGS